MDEGLFIYRLLIILNSLVKTIYERTTMYKIILIEINKKSPNIAI